MLGIHHWSILWIIPAKSKPNWKIHVKPVALEGTKAPPRPALNQGTSSVLMEMVTADPGRGWLAAEPAAELSALGTSWAQQQLYPSKLRCSVGQIQVYCNIYMTRSYVRCWKLWSHRSGNNLMFLPRFPLQEMSLPVAANIHQMTRHHHCLLWSWHSERKVVKG